MPRAKYNIKTFMSCGSFGVVPNCFTLPLSFPHNFRSSVPEDKTVFVQLVQIENEKYGNPSNDSDVFLSKFQTVLLNTLMSVLISTTR